MKTHLGEGEVRPLWRPLRRADFEAVMRLADRLHPDAQERAEVFVEKWRLFPAGCFALEQNGAMLGYAISHPFRVNEIPPLDAFLGTLPDRPDCLFLHDVAIAAQGRGYGCAAVLIDRLVDIAKQQKLPALALVSLYGSNVLWTRLGFEHVQDDQLAAQLARYGESASYMKKRI